MNPKIVNEARDYNKIVSFRPELVDPTAWIAPDAVVNGDVRLGANVSVWFGAVARGDTDTIQIGNDTNIQDLCCLHADPGFPCLIGARVTVGHAAVVHGATVADECLIGIRAVILTGATVGKHSIIGAGAVVREGQVVPERSVVVGVPAKVVREASDEDIQRILDGTDHYVRNAQLFKQQLESNR